MTMAVARVQNRTFNVAPKTPAGCCFEKDETERAIVNQTTPRLKQSQRQHWQNFSETGVKRIWASPTA